MWYRYSQKCPACKSYCTYDIKYDAEPFWQGDPVDPTVYQQISIFGTTRDWLHHMLELGTRQVEAHNSIYGFVGTSLESHEVHPVVQWTVPRVIITNNNSTNTTFSNEAIESRISAFHRNWLAGLEHLRQEAVRTNLLHIDAEAIIQNIENINNSRTVERNLKNNANQMKNKKHEQRHHNRNEQRRIKRAIKNF
jgi:hypothetical protein